MHGLLKRQIAKATGPQGNVDLEKLVALVNVGYTDADHDRRRTNRSIELMVTEIEQAQQNLVHAIELVPEGFVLLDSDDRYVLWNKKYGEIYSACADKIAVGTSFRETMSVGAKRGLFMRSVGREQEWLEARMEGHAMPRYTSEESLSGNRWVLVEERRTEDGGSVGIRIDITDLKRSEASLDILFEDNPVPMWIHTQGSPDLIVAANKAAILSYGYSGHQFAGMLVSRLASIDDKARRHHGASPNNSGDQIQSHARADGTAFTVKLHTSPIYHKGQSCGITAAIDLSIFDHSAERPARTN